MKRYKITAYTPSVDVYAFKILVRAPYVHLSKRLISYVSIMHSRKLHQRGALKTLR